MQYQGPIKHSVNIMKHPFQSYQYRSQLRVNMCPHFNIADNNSFRRITWLIDDDSI
jgi:hypothetical protein